MRLDLDGPPHRNPDGVEVPCPHLHVYREGFGDKWAMPAPAELVQDGTSFTACVAFMTRCNVVDAPDFEPGLF